MSAARFVVTGLVQGVGFRNFVWRRATDLGLAGHVRNLPDGSVEVVVAGDQAGVEELATLLRQGPRHARVDNVIRSQILDEVIADNSFHVKRF